MNAADAMLHDQTSFWIKQQLFGEDGVIVTDVPYHPSFDEEKYRALGETASERPEVEPPSRELGADQDGR
jgi:hypothetical protein